MRVHSSMRCAFATTIGLGLGSLCLNSTAVAGQVDAPDLKVIMQVNDGEAWEYSPMGSPNEDGTFTYNGEYGGGDWTMNYSGVINPDPSINQTIGIHNGTGVTNTYILTVILPIAAIAGPTYIAGSVSGSVQDFSGDGVAFMTSTLGTPVYMGQLDGLGVPASFLLLDPFSTAPVGLPGGFSFFGASFGLPVPPTTVIGPPALSTIAIQLKFTLTAGDDIAITSGFFVEPVPAPAGLALLGLAGMIGRRRRR